MRQGDEVQFQFQALSVLRAQGGLQRCENGDDIVADVEKVVKGLKCCKRGFCFACSYNDGKTESKDCKHALVDDALELLKAHEPVEPYGQYSVHTGTKYIVCGACEKPLCMMKDSYRPKYCPECGRMVKWHANEAQK